MCQAFMTQTNALELLQLYPGMATSAQSVSDGTMHRKDLHIWAIVISLLTCYLVTLFVDSFSKAEEPAHLDASARLVV